jgi:hypothetical protein
MGPLGGVGGGGREAACLVGSRNHCARRRLLGPADISIGDAHGVGYRALGRELRKLEGGAALAQTPPLRLIGRLFYMSVASEHVPPFLGNL